MIGCLRGKLLEVGADAVLVDVGGIGFEVSIHARALQALPGRDQPVTLFTRLHVSDNEWKLYGFMTRSEMELFRTLNGVSGIGPKVAMAILGHFEPERFYGAIAAKDVKSLTSVPGVGKKSAERIIFELKDRVPVIAGGGEVAVETEAEVLLEALRALGYSREEVYPQVRQLLNSKQPGTLEENLRQVLKAIGSR